MIHLAKSHPNTNLMTTKKKSTPAKKKRKAVRKKKEVWTNVKREFVKSWFRECLWIVGCDDYTVTYYFPDKNVECDAKNGGVVVAEIFENYPYKKASLYCYPPLAEQYDRDKHVMAANLLHEAFHIVLARIDNDRLRADDLWKEAVEDTIETLTGNLQCKLIPKKFRKK